jgi:hypothetical protein
MNSGSSASTRGRWAAFPLRLIVGYGFIAHQLLKANPRRWVNS